MSLHRTRTCTHSLTQNPDYMKDGFYIKIETIHVPNDVGQQENVSHRLVCITSLSQYDVHM